MPRTPEKSNFDLDLDFGQQWESRGGRMLEGEGSVEVKADKMWARTGNLAFEYSRYDMNVDDEILTGIMATKAHWWCNVIVDPQNEESHVAIRIWEVARLKKILMHLISQGRAWCKHGIGDGGRTNIICVPLENLTEGTLFDYELNLEKDFKTIRRRKAFQQEWDSSKHERAIWETLKFTTD